MIELEIEMRKVVKVELDDLKAKYPREWAETLDSVAGDIEEAERDFVIESWLADPSDFESTPYDDTDYTLTKLEAAA